MSSVRLLVGTRKAAFIYTSDDRRQRWERSEPLLAGWHVYHITADPHANGGGHWERLAGTLPPVLSVTCAEF